MSTHRTATGGRIDRSRTIRFTFDGKAMSGHPGDTLASALMANGVSVVGRSFKYHRPRGIFAAGIDEPNALVTIIRGKLREPNVPATQIELYDGLTVESQNRFPSLSFDLGAVSGLAGNLFAAGFYYKTFMGPVAGPLKGTRFWRFCEHFIRRAAGLGRAGYDADTNRYEKMFAFCDVLVVGAGPAGLIAARKAASEGKRVILAEQDATLGGALRWRQASIDGQPAAEWLAATEADLRTDANVTILPRTTVWGYYDGNQLAALERVTDHKAVPGIGEPRHRQWTITAKDVVLATGALERPIVFPGNDRPGILLAGAAARYAAEFGALPGRRIAIFTNNDSAYEAAALLRSAGAEIAVIVDVRGSLGEAARDLARQAGGELLPGHAVVNANGGKRLREIEVQSFADGKVGAGVKRSFAVDCLAVSGGWSPSIHLASQAGAAPSWDESLQAFLPPEHTQRWTGVGAFTGKFSTDDALGGEFDVDEADIDHAPAPVFEIRPSGKSGKAFVDFQHDVTASDIRLAHREGFQSVEHLKRYTTLGMATDQGKTSNVPGLAIMADARGIPISQAGTTRFRPPFSAVSIGSLASDTHGHFKPQRLTPMHDWHVERGAQMYAAGLWYRPMIYGAAGETVEQAYVREAHAARNGVGIVDVSTLGKIAVQGPDAGAFLDRVYTNMFSTLPVMKARYGLMLREEGIAFDDGTTWRLSEHEFLMTTTTANAGKVMQHLEYYLDCVWPDLRVHVTSVTDEWAGAAIAGPNARKVLETCVEGTPVNNDALPFMGIVRGEIAGAPVLICRLSFSGELAYEVYCGAGHGTHVWEALMAAGEPFPITPYGLEALGTLRIEKGHVTGAEIDGRTSPRDLYLDWMLSKKKPYIGSAMVDREGLVAENRIRLVGVVSLDDRPLNGGAHIVERLEDEPRGSIGHITAACYSPALERYIGLALVKGGKARHGQRAYISDPLRERFGPVEIVSHHFFDPEGSRMHG
jgi:sarcosine oxidase subunit alpha